MPCEAGCFRQPVGLGVLCLVQAIGALLPVNLFTVAVCGILGLPGAISLLVCNLMW